MSDDIHRILNSCPSVGSAMRRRTRRVLHVTFGSPEGMGWHMENFVSAEGRDPAPQ
jgi:hypothetical protein